jgi:pimeloyl-ACP methyl ester carboxylesterase
VLEPLSNDFFVLAMDLPEIGGSRGAPASAEKVVLANLMPSAAATAGARDITIAGLDVGGMIAFAAARDHGRRLSHAIVINTVIPGLEPWSKLVADPQIWHFAFHAVPELPETLVHGHERAYFDFFHDVLSDDPRRIPDAVRESFANDYARPEALKAGFDWYRAMSADAKRNAAPKAITSPILYIRGDADGRSIEPYLGGLKAAGATQLTDQLRCGTADNRPVAGQREMTFQVHCVDL